MYDAIKVHTMEIHTLTQKKRKQKNKAPGSPLGERRNMGKYLQQHSSSFSCVVSAQTPVSI